MLTDTVPCLSPSRSVWRRPLAVACWCYTGLVAVLLLGLRATPIRTELADWVSLPLQLIAIALCLVEAGRAGTRAPAVRTVALLAATYGVLLCLANVGWNVWRPLGVEPGLVVTDTLYLLGYVVMAALFGTVYVALGGSYTSRRFWTDAGIIFATELATFWAVLFEPLRANGNQKIDQAFTLGYAIVITGMLTMAAMILMRLPRLRDHPAVLSLVGAGLIETIWEVPWLTGWLNDQAPLDPLYNLGDALGFAMIVSAAAAAPRGPCEWPARRDDGAEPAAHNFLPAITVLLGILVVAGTLATRRAADASILIGMVVACVWLIVTRQAGVHRELVKLNRVLATREADRRLTELVRQSKDLILIVNDDGTVRFASAAADAVLGAAAGALTGRLFAGLFGPAHEAQLAGLVAGLRQANGAGPEPGVVEISPDSPSGARRVLSISGSNQLDNPLIGGLTFTIADVTEQRALQREVLTLATRERARIAADIHDGVGQELVGIALLLQGAATGRDLAPDAYRAKLKALVDQLNRAIGGARDIARGLSPLQVVRGSLADALARLGDDVAGALPVTVSVDPAVDAAVTDDLAADHVYRIAHEGVQNARRHSGGTAIAVACRVEGGALVLEVRDNGRGVSGDALRQSGLGLRLLQYRAHLIQGRLGIEALPGGGTRLCLAVPLKRLAPPPAAGC